LSVRTSTAAPVLALAASLLLTGCGPKHRLGAYEFRDSSVGVVSHLPRRPEILSGPYFLGNLTGDPVRDVLRVGARVYREVETRGLRDRLDTAVTRVDVGEVLEEHTLERAARYLGARPVGAEEGSEYLLELIVVEYGIDAESWDAAAHFYIEADATLIDRPSGEEIWRKQIDAREAIGTHVFGPGRAVRDVVTAASLADLTVEQMVVALESLAQFSGRVITDQLRDDLRKVRSR